MGAEGDGLNDRAGGAGKCSPPARQVQVERRHRDRMLLH